MGLGRTVEPVVVQRGSVAELLGAKVEHGFGTPFGPELVHPGLLVGEVRQRFGDEPAGVGLGGIGGRRAQFEGPRRQFLNQLTQTTSGAFTPGGAASF